LISWIRVRLLVQLKLTLLPTLLLPLASPPSLWFDEQLKTHTVTLILGEA